MPTGFLDLLVLQGLWPSKFQPPLVVKIAFSGKQEVIDFLGKGESMEFTGKQANITFAKVDC